MFRVTDTLTGQFFDVETRGDIYMSVDFILSAGDLTEFEETCYAELIEDFDTYGDAYNEYLNIKIEVIA